MDQVAVHEPFDDGFVDDLERLGRKATHCLYIDEVGGVPLRHGQPLIETFEERAQGAATAAGEPVGCTLDVGASDENDSLGEVAGQIVERSSVEVAPSGPCVSALDPLEH